MYRPACLKRVVRLTIVVVIASLGLCSCFRVGDEMDSLLLNALVPGDHRIRHARHRLVHEEDHRKQASPTITTEEHSIQIPPSDLRMPSPTTSLVSRSQRSYTRKSKNRRSRSRSRSRCQKQDLFRKVAKANTVMRARVVTLSGNRREGAPYNVTFAIEEVFKSREPENHETIRLTFVFAERPANCERDLGRGGAVRARLQASTPYYLFLNSHGSYNYTVYGLPVLVGRRNKTDAENGALRANVEKKIRRLVRKGFAQRLREPKLERKYDPEHKKHRITCRAYGFPTPLIEWYKDGEKLTTATTTEARGGHRVTYSRRKSTLVFEQLDNDARGRYRCATVGLGNETRHSNETVLDEGNRRFKGTPCNDTLSAICINGDCYFSETLSEPFCVCNNNFQGLRCEDKTIGELSTMEMR